MTIPEPAWARTLGHQAGRSRSCEPRTEDISAKRSRFAVFKAETSRIYFISHWNPGAKDHKRPQQPQHTSIRLKMSSPEKQHANRFPESPTLPNPPTWSPLLPCLILGPLRRAQAFIPTYRHRHNLLPLPVPYTVRGSSLPTSSITGFQFST